jgi:hypothetical protein
MEQSVVLVERFVGVLDKSGDAQAMGNQGVRIKAGLHWGGRRALARFARAGLRMRFKEGVLSGCRRTMIDELEDTLAGQSEAKSAARGRAAGW